MNRRAQRKQRIRNVAKNDELRRVAVQRKQSSTAATNVSKAFFFPLIRKAREFEQQVYLRAFLINGKKTPSSFLAACEQFALLQYRAA